jgi:purine-nucleoside/S-methyl-5'-thioadenosine phosphorylase / adenosine deaminase
LDFELIDDLYRARPLEQFQWLEHGFGTRRYVPISELTTLRQVHSDLCHYADRAGCLAEGDALLSDTPGRRIAVKTADCLPILLVDPAHHAVAAIHAGWRGVVAEIVPKTVRAMVARWESRPQELHAAIGPGIGGCCFEVGPEVAVQFGLPAERTRIDLTAEIERQLTGAGLSAERIYSAGLCTVCHTADFHSFRRDREQAGRMYSVISVKSAL